MNIYKYKSIGDVDKALSEEAEVDEEGQFGQQRGQPRRRGHPEDVLESRCRRRAPRGAAGPSRSASQ